MPPRLLAFFMPRTMARATRSAATVPIRLRSPSRSPAARANTRSPSNVVWAGEMARAIDEIEARVPARDDQHDRRQRELAVLQHQRFDMTGQMVDGHERQSRRSGSRLGERDADQQRPDQPGPLGHGDRTEVTPRGAGLAHRTLDDAADVADVLARREFGHDAAPLPMDRHLRRDDVGANGPRFRGVAGFFDHSGRGFVAGCLDAKDQHDSLVPRRPITIRHPDRRTPASGIRCTAGARCRVR